MSLLRFADLGATYANSTLVGPVAAPTGGITREGRRSSAKHWPTGSLIFIQGWSRQSVLALRALARRWPSLPPPVSLYVIADESLPTLRAPAFRARVGWRPDLDQLLTFSASQEILRRDSLAAFWSSNPEAAAHAKVAAFPRGVLDVDLWTRVLQSPMYRARASQGGARPDQLFCGCLSLRSSPARRAKLAILVRNGFSCLSGSSSCTVEGFARHVLSSRFVFSPRGNGDQNHRDWEALTGGAVPLVDFSPRTVQLWRCLPVVQVRNWSLVTPHNLDRLWERVLRHWASVERAYFPYWLSRVLSVQQSAYHPAQEL